MSSKAKNVKGTTSDEQLKALIGHKTVKTWTSGRGEAFDRLLSHHEVTSPSQLTAQKRRLIVEKCEDLAPGALVTALHYHLTQVGIRGKGRGRQAASINIEKLSQFSKEKVTI